MILFSLSLLATRDFQGGTHRMIAREFGVQMSYIVETFKFNFFKIYVMYLDFTC